MLAAMDLLVEVGSMAIPGVGKAITSGMSRSLLYCSHDAPL